MTDLTELEKANAALTDAAQLLATLLIASRRAKRNVLESKTEEQRIKAREEVLAAVWREEAALEAMEEAARIVDLLLEQQQSQD